MGWGPAIVFFVAFLFILLCLLLLSVGEISSPLSYSTACADSYNTKPDQVYFHILVALPFTCVNQYEGTTFTKYIYLADELLYCNN